MRDLALRSVPSAFPSSLRERVAGKATYRFWQVMLCVVSMDDDQYSRNEGRVRYVHKRIRHGTYFLQLSALHVWQCDKLHVIHQQMVFTRMPGAREECSRIPGFKNPPRDPGNRRSWLQGPPPLFLSTRIFSSLMIDLESVHLSFLIHDGRS